MSSSKINKKYFNPGQIEMLEVAANSETIIASRRFGKSDGIIAPRILRNVQQMPRSTGSIVAATFQQALSRTIPAAMVSLARLGYEEGKHYYLGRKAPLSVGFGKPLIPPGSYEHVIHWYNGSIQHIISLDVPFSANSLTLDYSLIDEARSIKPEKFKNDVVPAISGYPGAFENIPWHKGITIVSDMPQNKSGEWLLNREKLMNVALIELIKDLKRELNYYSSKKTQYANNKVSALLKDLTEFRKEAHYFRKFDSIDNLEILGESYIRQMKRELTPLVFQLSIANEYMRQAVGGFYPNLNSKIHYYQASNPHHINNLRKSDDSFDFEKIKRINCQFDSDIDKAKPLQIAFDYNANINWVVTGQVLGQELRVLSSFYTKFEKKLRTLCQNWADYYAMIKLKEVIYYFDATAITNSYADETGESFSEIVISELERKGWSVLPIYIGKPMAHSLKHQYIDDALTGKRYLFPTFNELNNESLLLAMEQAKIKIGRNGFEKDKSGEKLIESEGNELELRTDGTDSFDTLFVGANFFQSATSRSISYSISNL